MAHLKPVQQLTELGQGPMMAAIHILGPQAGLVVGESQQRLPDLILWQAFAPALARSPVSPLAMPIHLQTTPIEVIQGLRQCPSTTICAPAAWHYEIWKYCQSTGRVQGSVLQNLRVHGWGPT